MLGQRLRIDIFESSYSTFMSISLSIRFFFILVHFFLHFDMPTYDGLLRYHVIKNLESEIKIKHALCTCQKKKKNETFAQNFCKVVT